MLSATLLAALIGLVLLLPKTSMNFFSMFSTLIARAAVSSYANYRDLELPTTIGVMLCSACVPAVRRRDPRQTRRPQPCMAGHFLARHRRASRTD